VGALPARVRCRQELPDRSATKPTLPPGVAVAVLVAALSGFVLHVLYGRGCAETYVQTAAKEGRLKNVLHEPYPIVVVVLPFVLAAVPAFRKVIASYLCKERLPGQTRLIRGVWFALLMMGMTYTLIRLPLINLVIGNTLGVSLVQARKDGPSEF
jgi:hypothetical protein